MNDNMNLNSTVSTWSVCFLQSTYHLSQLVHESLIPCKYLC